MPSGNVNTTTDLGPKVAASVHVLYRLLRPVWEKLVHVREGTGGFLDGTYLVAHPREWLDHTSRSTNPDTNVTTITVNPNPRAASPKLKARRAIARYENVASAILETKKALLFREQPTRRIGTDAPAEGAKPSELEQWWANIDGDDTHIDDALPLWWDLAGTLGHVVLLFDVAQATEASTAADQGWPYVRVYTPLDVLDWRRNDDGALVWIKLLEAVPTAPTTIDGPMIPEYRVRIIDEKSWRTYSYKTGKYVDQGDHGLGRLPVVYLYGKRRSLLADVGDSVLGDPRNYIDLFNLTSEIRELLRNQTFSFINLPLGGGPDAQSVTDAQAMLGQQTGTMNVLFSGLEAKILTGDPANVQSYHDEIARVKREIYRETGVQWEADTTGVEAQGALEIKREDMTTRMAAYADELQQTEYGLVDLFYRWRYGADAGPKKLEKDQVQIHYPEHFAQTPFKDVLDEAAAAQSLGMPALFLKALRKAMVTKFEGMANLDPSTLKAIFEQIDAAPDDPTPAERMKQKMDIIAAASNGQIPAGAKPGPDGVTA